MATTARSSRKKTEPTPEAQDAVAAESTEEASEAGNREDVSLPKNHPFFDYDPFKIRENGRKLLQKLAARFDPSDVKQRPGGGGQMLDYISIDTALNRADEVLGMEWGFEIQASTLTQTGQRDSRDNPLWLGVVVGHVTLFDGRVKRGGVGAAVNVDPDMAFKTALAEAQKKALVSFGVGRYLWDEAERALLAVQRKDPSAMSLDELKKAVYDKALAAGLTDHTPLGVAKMFGVDIGDLQDPDVLREILRR